MATAAAGARGGATTSASPSQTASGATLPVNTSALSAALSQVSHCVFFSVHAFVVG